MHYLLHPIDLGWLHKCSTVPHSVGLAECNVSVSSDLLLVVHIVTVLRPQKSFDVATLAHIAFEEQSSHCLWSCSVEACIACYFLPAMSAEGSQFVYWQMTIVMAQLQTSSIAVPGSTCAGFAWRHRQPVQAHHNMQKYYQSTRNAHAQVLQNLTMRRTPVTIPHHPARAL